MFVGYRLDPSGFRGDYSACTCDLARSDIIECNRRIITMKVGKLAGVTICVHYLNSLNRLDPLLVKNKPVMLIF